MLGHLVAKVPGQRLRELGRQGVLAATRASATASAWVPAGQRDEHQEPDLALHQRGDRAHVLAEDQVAFPVPGHGSVLGLGRPFGDVQRVRLAAVAVGQPHPLGPADHPAGAQITGSAPCAARRGTARRGSGRCSRVTPASPDASGRSASATACHRGGEAGSRSPPASTSRNRHAPQRPLHQVETPSCAPAPTHPPG